MFLQGIVNFFNGSGEEKKRRLVAFAAFILLVGAASPVIRPVSFLYPIVPLLLFCFIFTFRKELKTPEAVKVLLIMLPFGIWASLTAFWSYYPLVSLMRGGYYLFLVTGLVAVTTALRKNGISIFQFLFALNMVIAAIAVFSLITKIPDDSWSGGNAKGLMGFFSHQNSLGALLLFTFPGWLFMFTKKQTYSRENHSEKITFASVFLLIGILLNLFLILLTYSRASLLSFFIMVALWGMFEIKDNVSLKLLVVTVAIGAFLLLPLLAGHFKLINKGDHEKSVITEFWLKEGESFMSTREQLFKDSWKAAGYGGFLGIGYGVSHPEIRNNAAGSDFNEAGRYIREKGNSFLALVEETGVMGLLLLLLQIGVLVRKYYQNNQFVTICPGYSISSTVYVIVPIILHAQLESWMLGFSVLILLATLYLLNL